MGAEVGDYEAGASGGERLADRVLQAIERERIVGRVQFVGCPGGGASGGAIIAAIAAVVVVIPHVDEGCLAIEPGLHA